MSTLDSQCAFMSSTIFQQPRPSEEYPQLNKGKGKERQVLTEHQDSSIRRTSSDATSYPPINDDDEETRRVEEASLASGQLATL